MEEKEATFNRRKKAAFLSTSLYVSREEVCPRRAEEKDLSEMTSRLSHRSESHYSKVPWTPFHLEAETIFPSIGGSHYFT